MIKRISLATVYGTLAASASMPLVSTYTFAQVLEEVVVTAQRRSESSQDTPIAITGLSSDSLAKFGFQSANDISAQVPNMQVSSPYGEVQPIFSIRGVSMSDYTSNQASPIGVYVDESYLGAVFTHGMSFFDVERLEVLRGPQGTLYGKNTTGGAINIITKTPMVGDEWTGNIKFGAGSHGQQSAEGAVGGTMIEDTLAARIAFKYKADDGYYENQLGGDDLGQTDFLAGRVVLNWQATDSVNAVLKYSHGKNDGTATPPRNEPRTDIRGIDPALGNGYPNDTGYIDYSGYDRNSQNLDFHETQDNRAVEGDNAMVSEMDLAVMTLTYEAHSYSLMSISSWSDADYFQQANTDGAPSRLLEIDWHTAADSLSQDLRFISNFDSSFSIVGGLYWGKEENHMQNIYYLYEDLVDARVPFAKPATAGQAPFVVDFGAIDQRQDMTKETKAAYTQMRFDVTADFGIDLGLRYTIDNTSQPYLNISRIDYDGTPRGTFIPGNTGPDTAFVPAPVPTEVLEADANNPTGFITIFDYLVNLDPTATPGYTDGPYTLESAPELEAEEKEWTGKLGLDYRFNDTLMVYGSYSMGYRAGSFNGGIYYAERPLETSYAKPEYIDAYELGFKADLLDNSLRINGALFFYEYEDQQFISVVGISNYLQNAGGAEILGFEAELWWAATERMVIQLGLGMLETEYTELVLQNIETIDEPADTIDLAGNELISAPPINFSASIDYDLLMTDYGYLTVNANANFQDDQWYSAYNDEAGHEHIRQDAYWLYSGRLSWNAADESYQVSAWIKNATNEEYDSYAINLQAAFGYDYYMAGPPRTWGVEVNWSF